MKRIITIALLLVCISSFAQKKDYAVVKANGDTVWCNSVEIKKKGSNKIKYITVATDDSTYNLLEPEVAFVISPGKTELIGDGYCWGELLITGTNYYLTIDRDAALPVSSNASNTSTVTGNYDPKYCTFQVLDKNRKFVKSITNDNKFYKSIKEYFGENTAFIAKIDALQSGERLMPTVDQAITMCRQYNNPEKN